MKVKVSNSYFCVYTHLYCKQEQYGNRNSIGDRLWRSAEMEVM